LLGKQRVDYSGRSVIVVGSDGSSCISAGPAKLIWRSNCFKKSLFIFKQAGSGWVVANHHQGREEGSRENQTGRGGGTFWKK